WTFSRAVFRRANPRGQRLRLASRPRRLPTIPPRVEAEATGNSMSLHVSRTRPLRCTRARGGGSGRSAGSGDCRETHAELHARRGSRVHAKPIRPHGTISKRLMRAITESVATSCWDGASVDVSMVRHKRNVTA